MIIGHWESTVTFAGQDMKIVLDLAQDMDGITGTFGLPDRGLEDLPMANLRFVPPNLDFEHPQFGAVFESTVEGDAISGEMTFQGVSSPFNLERKGTRLEVRLKPEVTDTVVQYGDLVVRGDEVFEISNARFVLRGSLVVRDEATFRATNVLWDVPQEFNKQFGIRVQDNATFELDNVFIDSGGPWLDIDFLGSSNVRLNNVWSPDPNIPWHTVQEGPRVLIEDSVVGLTPFADATAQVTIKRSNTWIEIKVPGDGELQVSLPSGSLQAWSLPPGSVTGIPYTIKSEDTTFRPWSIGLSPGSRVTVRDTERINLFFGVGCTWSEAEVEIRDLRPGFVEDRTWEVDGAVLRAINAGINEWYPQRRRERQTDLG